MDLEAWIFADFSHVVSDGRVFRNLPRSMEELEAL